MINAKFGSWEEFTAEFQKQAMTVQGSGWVYLARSGDIKIIPNHQVRDDILILVDLRLYFLYS
jgi:superoxide dismutase